MPRVSRSDLEDIFGPANSMADTITINGVDYYAYVQEEEVIGESGYPVLSLMCRMSIYDYPADSVRLGETKLTFNGESLQYLTGKKGYL